MKHFALLMFGFVVSLGQISGQTTIISSKPARWTSPTLDSTFSQYEIFSIDTKALKESFSGKETQKRITISIAEKTWTLNAQSSGICPSGTPVQVDKTRTSIAFDPTFKGFTQQGLPFRLTINDGFVAGFLPLDNNEYFIEPLNNIDARAAAGLFVLYEKRDLIARSNKKCLVKDINQHYNTTLNNNFRVLNDCAIVELAVATDVSMYQKYSTSTTAVQNRVTSIMNLVEGLYQTSFSHKIKFTIVTWFQSTGADPWTGSTSAGNVLDSFSTWGPNGFNLNYDLGQFWTNRNFDGSTIGIAWVGGVCANKFRHHALQDFSTSDAFMRCMVAHEIGHNFDMSHNSDIMAPTVSASTTWSASSIAQINSFLPSVLGTSCLAPCSTGGGGGGTGAPPVANFSVAANDTFCINKQILFEDKSLNNPYTYKWTFEGGTPAISALSDPKVLYKNPGTYAVSLEVTNAYGTNTKTINIIAVAIPIVTFSYQINALSVAFTNTSTGPATWSWKFGDGKTSTQKNPTHTYSNNGSFNAQLSATNTCGSKTASKIVPVFAATPVAAFNLSVGSGCTPFIIQLNNISTNAQSYIWELPGAQGSSSFEKNPTVVYTSAGVFDIKLIAFNGTLSDTFLLKNAVHVKSAPNIAFNSFIYFGGLTQFKNQTTGASSLKWEFGDGSTSKDSIPLHYYLKSGTYIVK
ncbi:MAG: PKD domain-containing protein, partial [Saprospiraceae bacterium]